MRNLKRDKKKGWTVRWEDDDIRGRMFRRTIHRSPWPLGGGVLGALGALEGSWRGLGGVSARNPAGPFASSAERPMKSLRRFRKSVKTAVKSTLFFCFFLFSSSA